MSCPVRSEACRKAQDEDPKRLNSSLWQACIYSPPSSEKDGDFRKAKLACVNSAIDYNKAYQYSCKAEAMCHDAGRNCPLAQLVRAEVLKKQPLTSLNCNNYNSNSSSCPEADLSWPKVELAFSEAKKVCSNTKINKKSPNTCPKAWVEFYDFYLSFLVDLKSCRESEFNGTTNS